LGTVAALKVEIAKEEAKATLETLRQSLVIQELVPVVDKLTDAFVRQLAELRNVNAEDNKMRAQRQQETALVGVQGVEHDLLIARFKAENEQMLANATLTGLALDERTRAIQ